MQVLVFIPKFMYEHQVLNGTQIIFKRKETAFILWSQFNKSGTPKIQGASFVICRHPLIIQENPRFETSSYDDLDQSLREDTRK